MARSATMNKPLPLPQDDVPAADRGEAYDKAGAGDLADENIGGGGDYRGNREFGGFSDQDFGSQGYSGQGYGDRSFGDPDYGGQAFARGEIGESALEPATTAAGDVEAALDETQLEEPADAAVDGETDDETRRPDGEDEEYNDEETRT
jgi:hypothetical protein